MKTGVVVSLFVLVASAAQAGDRRVDLNRARQLERGGRGGDAAQARFHQPQKKVDGMQASSRINPQPDMPKPGALLNQATQQKSGRVGVDGSVTSVDATAVEGVKMGKKIDAPSQNLAPQKKIDNTADFTPHNTSGIDATRTGR